MKLEPADYCRHVLAFYEMAILHGYNGPFVQMKLKYYYRRISGRRDLTEIRKWS